MKGKQERDSVREGDETGEGKGRQVLDKKRSWRTEMAKGGTGGERERQITEEKNNKEKGGAGRACSMSSTSLSIPCRM